MQEGKETENAKNPRISQSQSFKESKNKTLLDMHCEKSPKDENF